MQEINYFRRLREHLVSLSESETCLNYCFYENYFVGFCNLLKMFRNPLKRYLRSNE